MSDDGRRDDSKAKRDEDEMRQRLVTLDWAIKRLLRSKANFDILEGFLSELLKQDIEIIEILESESNRDREAHKSNRVDLKTRLADGKIAIIEVQVRREADFLKRLLWATSRVITEHMRAGEAYHDVTKVITVGILHFDLGKGEDYIYHGQMTFQGLRRKDMLEAGARERDEMDVERLQDAFPDYYLIKVNSFDDVARNTLDEWIYTLKNGRVPENFSAKGLARAREVLDRMRLDDAEQAAYEEYLEDLRYEASMQRTAILDGRYEGRKEGRKEGREEGMREGIRKGVLTTARNLLATLDDETIAQATGLTVEEIVALRAEGGE